MVPPPRRNYFVAHLPLHDPQRKEGKIYRVEVVNSFGQGIVSAFLGRERLAITLGGQVVPNAVIDVVFGLPPASGMFVNADGHELSPLDLLDED